MAAPPTTGALKEHALYCFEAINERLGGHEGPFVIPSFDQDDEFPLFVTWNIQSRSGGESRLRGCIGNFEPMPLGEGLKDYAVISAFKDHRFNPIGLKELSRLECDISLLTEFELCDNIYDWDIDTHGIHITFSNPALTPSSTSSSTPSSSLSSSSRSTPLSSTTTSSASLSTASTSSSRRSFRSISQLPTFSPPTYPNPKGLHRTLSATYLPNVIKEQRWTKDEALESLVRKAGWKGSFGEDLKNGMRVARYQSRKAGVTYQEWVGWRKEQGY